MPEGPEIRRAADKVAAVLVGEKIEKVGFGLEHLKPFEERLSGCTVTAVDTRGKAMLTRFDNRLTIYSHNQLYGRWYTVRRPRMPKTQRQLRVEFRNRLLGSLYLDQAFLAGNGNYLRSEILWAAGIEPKRKAASLTSIECDALARETLKIAWRSYRSGGVTLTPAMASRLRAEGISRKDYRFYVFGREGRPCRRCGTKVERHKMGGRNLFTCRRCQPAE
jgi:endonuclease-8